MSQQNKEVKKLAEEFENCKKILTALGDENRQHLILDLLGCHDL